MALFWARLGLSRFRNRRQEVVLFTGRFERTAHERVGREQGSSMPFRGRAYGTGVSGCVATPRNDNQTRTSPRASLRARTGCGSSPTGPLQRHQHWRHQLPQAPKRPRFAPIDAREEGRTDQRFQARRPQAANAQGRPMSTLFTPKGRWARCSIIGPVPETISAFFVRRWCIACCRLSR